MKCKNCNKDIDSLYHFTGKKYCSESCEKRAELPKEFKDLFQTFKK